MKDPHPGPGTLQVLAYRATYAVAHPAPDVLDALVTVKLCAGTPIGFRFFPQTYGYLSQYSSTVVHVLTADVESGSFLRLTDHGCTLMVLERDCETDVLSAPNVVGTASTPPAISNLSSCYIFIGKHAQPVSFIGFEVDGISPIVPPEHIVPGAFSTVLPISSSTYPSTLSKMISYTHQRRGIPSAWIRAWQLLKFGASTNWTATTLSSPTTWNTDVTALENSIVLQLEPGHLTAIAYRPHVVSEVGFSAQLVTVLTQPIPACTRVYIVPTLSAAAPDFSTTPMWLWISPSYESLPAGTVLDFKGLSAVSTPHVNRGTISKINTWPLSDVDILGFTLYSLQTAAVTIPYIITAVYSSSHTYPIHATTYANLVPGVSMLSTPWPTTGSILPLDKFGSRPVQVWRAEMVRLANMHPVRWLCQPRPAFRSALPHSCNCWEKPAYMGVGGNTHPCKLHHC